MNTSRILHWISDQIQQKKTYAALKQAAASFAHLHPDWAASLFDEHFLLVHASACDNRSLDGLSHITPEPLVKAWLEQVHISPTAQSRIEKDLAQAVTDYLKLLQGELQDPANSKRAEQETVKV